MLDIIYTVKEDMMSFTTLTKRGRSLNSHIKQSSFDVSELAAVGRMNSRSTAISQSNSTGKLSPLKPFKKFTQFIKRQTSDSGVNRANQSSSSTENTIFGRSLSEICCPEPPKPITDLLTFLQEVGPFTKEIFRKPPNARKCKILAEKLNTANFYWDVGESCNGLLLGAVLKTFLREIPNKLCDDRLYNQWSAIINDQGSDNHERKVECIKRMLYRLPQGNQHLLRHLVCALYKIQQRSAENLMTASNLSICLGPCLLWTKSTHCKEVEKASKTVPRLIEFIITNCIEIYGRSMILLLSNSDNGLLRNTSLSMDSVFTEKQCCTFQDSSCQSINTLTDQLGRRLQSPSRLSYDSGMILDDGSHDEEINVVTKTTTPIHQRFNVSYDSMDCVSDEDINSHIAKLDNNNSLYANIQDLPPSTSANKQISPLDSRVRNNRADVLSQMAKYQSRYATLNRAHKRNTVSVPKRDLRPTILPQEVTRCPSISYDKIVYRYISETSPSYSCNDTFYSLPRPARRTKATNIIPSDSGHKMPSRTIPVEPLLAPITCGQSKWRSDEVPLIVIDGNQELMYQNTTRESPRSQNTIHQQTLKVQTVNYLQRPKSLDLNPVYQNVNNLRKVEEPIYENSELYGPAPAQRKQRTRSIVYQSPVYENLNFHKQPPAVQIRRKTLNLETSVPECQVDESLKKHGQAPANTLTDTSKSATVYSCRRESQADYTYNKAHAAVATTSCNTATPSRRVGMNSMRHCAPLDAIPVFDSKLPVTSGKEREAAASNAKPLRHVQSEPHSFNEIKQLTQEICYFV